jgi:hypothetical protein
MNGLGQCCPVVVLMMIPYVAWYDKCSFILILAIYKMIGYIDLHVFI